MNYNMKHIIIVCLLTVCHTATMAQIYHLSLEESIEIAKKQSFEIQNLFQEKIIAENELKAATALLKTRVTMNLTLPQYTETIQQWEDSEGISFFPIQTLRGEGTLNISQPLPTDGTIIVRSGLSSINDYNTDKRASTLNTSIGLSQSLNAFWGYNQIRSELKRARLNYERASKEYKRAELDMIYNVSSSYYRLLLLQKSSEIAQMNLERQTEAYEISKNKFDAGLIREVENLQNEVDLAEAKNTYDVSALNLVSSTNTFKKLIGLELNATITLRSQMDEYFVINIDPDKAVEMAIQNRLEIKNREIQIELQKLQIRRQKSEGSPQAYLEASWNKIGISNIAMSDPYSTSLSDTWDNFTTRPSNYVIGLRLSIPILDWGRNRQLVKSAEARLKQYYLGKEDEERGIEIEVRNLVFNLQTTLSRLQLLEKNVSVAERSYSITLQRYTDGDVDSQTFALERQRLNTARQNHLDAFVNYRLQLADLMRKTFYDFEKNTHIE